MATKQWSSTAPPGEFRPYAVSYTHLDVYKRQDLRIPLSDGRNLSLVHATGRVLHSEVADGHMHLEAELPESLARRLEDFARPTATKTS